MFSAIGQKVKLIYTDDEYTKIVPGDIGVVDFIDGTGTVFVKWDKGSYLGLIPNHDKWEIIK